MNDEPTKPADASAINAGIPYPAREQIVAIMEDPANPFAKIAARLDTAELLAKLRLMMAREIETLDMLTKAWAELDEAREKIAAMRAPAWDVKGTVLEIEEMISLRASRSPSINQMKLWAKGLTDIAAERDALAERLRAISGAFKDVQMTMDTGAEHGCFLHLAFFGENREADANAMLTALCELRSHGG